MMTNVINDYQVFGIKMNLYLTVWLGTLVFIGLIWLIPKIIKKFKFKKGTVKTPLGDIEFESKEDGESVVNKSYNRDMWLVATQIMKAACETIEYQFDYIGDKFYAFGAILYDNHLELMAIKVKYQNNKEIYNTYEARHFKSVVRAFNDRMRNVLYKAFLKNKLNPLTEEEIFQQMDTKTSDLNKTLVELYCEDVYTDMCELSLDEINNIFYKSYDKFRDTVKNITKEGNNKIIQTENNLEAYIQTYLNPDFKIERTAMNI